MALISQLESIMLSMLQQSLAARVGITLLIIAAGLGVARITARVTRYIWLSRVDEDATIERIRQRDYAPDRVASYTIILVTLAAATIYINASAANQIASQVATYVPRIMTSLLVFLFGVVLVRGLMAGLRILVHNLDVREYAESIGVSTKLMDAFFAGIKVFLYLVVVELAAVQIGVSPQIINNTLTATSYGIVLLLVLLGFFGFKDLIQNYAAGVYLRGSDVLKPGKRVKVDEETGEIRDISMFGTTITTDSGYFMLTPNQRLMDKQIMFKRVKADVDTLEDIKNYFVAQDPSYCGPASAEMALTMFGFDLTQGDLGEIAQTEVGTGTMPDDLVTAVEELTRGEVRAAYVDYQHITDLAEETKTWFNDGALIIPNFAKPVLFPEADTAHYALSVGVEGQELLIVDPSTQTMSGGVYYVEAAEMLEAMEEYEGRERGYVVLAPKGTTAYWRIKEGLIYSDASLYDHLSKSLELQLGRILRRGRILKQATPEAVDDFLDQWRREEKVKRVWQPEGQPVEGDHKLDEFTDTDE